MTELMHALPDMEGALRTLWRDAFGDGDEYLDLFFSEYPAERFALAAVCDGQVASALYLLPMTLARGKRKYPAQYVYAVATDKEYRRRALMRSLLDRAAEEASRSGIEALVTVPSNAGLFPYYTACGFETGFYADTLTKDVEPADSIEFTKTTLCAQKKVRDAFFSRFPLYGQWDEDALAYRDRETALLGGQVLAFERDGRPAYLAAVPDENTLRITEMTCEADDAVLRSAAGYFNCRRIRVRIPGSGAPFAMLRICGSADILHKKGALSLVLD